MAELEKRTPAFSEDRVRALVEGHRHERGPLVEVLHAVQDELGYIDSRSVPIVAEALNLSRAEVHGVISFYRDFRREPPPASTVQICRAEACQSVGAERLVARACERLGISLGERTPDGRIGLEQVFCLGNCALGPSMTFDGRLVGLVDEARLDALLGSMMASSSGSSGSKPP